MGAFRVAFAIAAALAVADSAAAGTARLSAEAGLGGIVRSGRWAPVRIIVDNDSSEFHGTLVVRWGSATVRRQVRLGAHSRNEFEIYVRAVETGDRMSIDLQDGDDIVSHVDAPVSVVADETPVAICVSGGADADPKPCAATIRPAALPRSLRGYDAADRVEPSIAADPIGSSERSAIDAWRTYHALEESGALAVAPRPLPLDASRRLPTGLRRVAVLLGVQVSGFALLAVVPKWRRRRPLAVCGALVAISSAAVFTEGLGLGASPSPLYVHSTTLLQLTESTSLVASRGALEFPFDDRWTVTTPFDDGAFEVAGQSEQTFDDRGHPMIAGAFGLGATREVRFEAVTEFAPFVNERYGDRVRVSNRSPYDLTDCEMSAAAGVSAVGALAPGAAIDIEAGTSGEPFLTCRVAGFPFHFSANGGAVRTAGSTRASVFLSPPLGGGDR